CAAMQHAARPRPSLPERQVPAGCWDGRAPARLAPPTAWLRQRSVLEMGGLPRVLAPTAMLWQLSYTARGERRWPAPQVRRPAT
ncbi:Na(+)-translocating NADH-quinone reductase subunit E, partial [Salmonella enterica subsp. enterica serovar Infantis]